GEELDAENGKNGMRGGKFANDDGETTGRLGSLLPSRDVSRGSRLAIARTDDVVSSFRDHATSYVTTVELENGPALAAAESRRLARSAKKEQRNSTSGKHLSAEALAEVE
ncbi:unnamed protein product, partial [Amoebophrya sp. A25]